MSDEFMLLMVRVIGIESTGPSGSSHPEIVVSVLDIFARRQDRPMDPIIAFLAHEQKSSGSAENV